MSLPKSSRILKSSEFRSVYQTGTRMTSRYFVAFCRKQSEEAIQPSRIGFTIPKAVGKAVKRNRIRRRMREAVKTQVSLIPLQWCVVFNPRRNMIDAPFLELCQEIGRIFTRCKQF